jgi:hypothetical protein
VRSGRLRSRTNGVGVLGVGALDSGAARCPNVHASFTKALAGAIKRSPDFVSGVSPSTAVEKAASTKLFPLEIWYIESARLF